MSLPYFPMFPSDFEAKTSHLTLEEDGAYNRLLRLMWMTPGCSLPDDDAWIMRRMRVDAATYERVVRVVIDEFCIRENGRVSNAKLTRVFEESSEKHIRRVLAGSKGGKSKALKSKETVASNATAKPKQPEPEPDIEEREAKASPKKPAKRKTRIPEDAVLSDKFREIAEGEGLSSQEAEAQFLKFKDNNLANGRTYADWTAAWRNWLRSPYFRPLTNVHPIRKGQGYAERLDDLYREASAALASNPF